MTLTTKKNILIFGGGILQKSIIQKCKDDGIITIVIDPSHNAICKNVADFYEVIDGNDFKGTCNVVEKYSVSGILTAATDKPLIMMAKIAKKYDLPFFSVKTAELTTDKFQMKEVFRLNGLPHADGKLIEGISEDLIFPAILKPRDNSGSRGVILCYTNDEAEKLISEVFTSTKLSTVLYEEYIDGAEFSVEAVHTEDQTIVVQYTEKITTKFPYNVELGHIVPAELGDESKEKINLLIEKIANSFQYKNCVSHTELKIKKDGEICIIETSPRLGGDYITSDLVPLSTSVDIERCLIDLSLGKNLTNVICKNSGSVGIFYFNFAPGTINRLNSQLNSVKDSRIIKKEINIEEGEKVPDIRSSLDRYGFFILKSDNRKNLLIEKETIMWKLENIIL
jgi:biotin carboxylase